MRNIHLTIGIVALLLLQGCAMTSTAWMAAEDRQAGKRFIPIELWSGETWVGQQDLAARPADTTFGSRNNKRIKGPFDWKHPITGKTLMVYERIHATTKGTKRQLFTINPDRSGLAKVFDERPGQPTRVFSENAVLFPLGWWRKGEKRTFDYTEYVDGRAFKRTALVYMRRLSFSYKDTTFAMKYDWIASDEQHTVLFHERFIYAPGNSLMYFKDRLKR